MNLLYAAVAGWLLYSWYGDLRKQMAGEPAGPAPWPGATPASRPMLFVAFVGALLILAAETGGEIALGVSEEQSDIQVIFLLSMLAAAVVEEVIFRGYLISLSPDPLRRWGVAIGASFLFALLHPFLWSYEAGPNGDWYFWEASFGTDFSAKALFSTGIVFANSLFFYWLRLSKANPQHSLAPCMLAHAASNLGVFFVKLAQGHVTGWY